QANGEGRQPVGLAGGVAEQQFGGPGNQCREVIESWSMIVFRIVLVNSVAYELDQEVSIDSFVVMQRDKREIVQTQHRSNEENRARTDTPDALRHVVHGWRLAHATSTLGFGSSRTIFATSLLVMA